MMNQYITNKLEDMTKDFDWDLANANLETIVSKESNNKPLGMGCFIYGFFGLWFSFCIGFALQYGSIKPVIVHILFGVVFVLIAALTARSNKKEFEYIQSCTDVYIGIVTEAHKEYYGKKHRSVRNVLTVAYKNNGEWNSDTFRDDYIQYTEGDLVQFVNDNKHERFLLCNQNKYKHYDTFEQSIIQVINYYE